MRARIPRFGRGGLSLDNPGLDIVVPDGRAQVEDYFQLDQFTLSKATAVPLEEVTVSWTISPKRPDVDLGQSPSRCTAPTRAWPTAWASPDRWTCTRPL